MCDEFPCAPKYRFNSSTEDEFIDYYARLAEYIPSETEVYTVIVSPIDHNVAGAEDVSDIE